MRPRLLVSFMTFLICFCLMICTFDMHFIACARQWVERRRARRVGNRAVEAKRASHLPVPH